MDEQSIRLAGDFLRITGKHTQEWVSTKLGLAKEKNELEEQQLVYEDIINKLLQDKMDLQFVTREYKTLYEDITISDKDIEYLQQTIQNVMGLLADIVPDLDNDKDNINDLIKLINKDTLKTMQLIGFNYKEAIGIPLTEVCANRIHSTLGNSDEDETED